VLLLAGAACLSQAGCTGSTWDDMTSKEFSFKGWFAKPPDPLTVLRDDSDGDHRARALRALSEPKVHGGTDAEQDAIVQILSTAAAGERSAYCRLAAIQSLSTFKDARVVPRLPKTRSGKILRASIRRIADGEPVPMPPTIEDPAVLDEVREALSG